MEIFVTKALLPPEQEFFSQARDIFHTHILTNNGPLVRKLESALKDYLQVPYLLLCTNGTIAIELALHAAGAAGRRIITTPFTYVATISAPLWIGCEVVFADIDPETLTINPEKIGELLTDDTFAILPVDVYGHCCNFSEIAKVAGSVPVIYDAAQAFGSKFHGKSLFEFGDYSTCSLHATKTLHTFEGGFIVCKSEAAYKRLDLLRAFGHKGDTHFSLGTNAKMSEIHAAMGLSLLSFFERAREERKKLTEIYDSLLAWEHVRKPCVPDGFESNYAYFPVIFESEKALLNILRKLASRSIHPRRYFYPCLTQLPYLHAQSCPVAEDIAKRILCLPLYAGLSPDTVDEIASVVNQNLSI